MVNHQHITITKNRHAPIGWQPHRVQPQQLGRHRQAGLHHRVVLEQAGNHRHIAAAGIIIRVSGETQPHNAGLAIDGTAHNALIDVAIEIRRGGDNRGRVGPYRCHLQAGRSQWRTWRAKGCTSSAEACAGSQTGNTVDIAALPRWVTGERGNTAGVIHGAHGSTGVGCGTQPAKQNARPVHVGLTAPLQQQATWHNRITHRRQQIPLQAGRRQAVAFSRVSGTRLLRAHHQRAAKDLLPWLSDRGHVGPWRWPGESAFLVGGVKLGVAVFLLDLEAEHAGAVIDAAGEASPIARAIIVGLIVHLSGAHIGAFTRRHLLILARLPADLHRARFQRRARYSAGDNAARVRAASQGRVDINTRLVKIKLDGAALVWRAVQHQGDAARSIGNRAGTGIAAQRAIAIIGQGLADAVLHNRCHQTACGHTIKGQLMLYADNRCITTAYVGLQVYIILTHKAVNQAGVHVRQRVEADADRAGGKVHRTAALAR